MAAVVEDRGRFLLIEEETDEGLRINQPAGHLDPGESLLSAVRREALEETAHEFAPQALLGVYHHHVRASDATYLRFAFCGALGARHSDRALDTGIVRILWMTAEEIRAASARHRTPLVARCVEDFLSGRRYPLDLLQGGPD